jgi:pimeloyl-ACP methyl ester carboxylesterase
VPTITTTDGTEIFYKDRGEGQPIVFSHGWPLSSDDWDAQIYYFASRGFRCIAHDRRGHGRSSQTWDKNDMNTYADDLAELTAALDLKNVPTLVMHGDDDQIVPVGASAMLSSKLVPGAQLKVFDGLPHGMCTTHHEIVNPDLLAFIQAEAPQTASAG